MFRQLKSLFAAAPPIVYQHPEFGPFTRESSGKWSGIAQYSGREIRVWVGGTPVMPDAALLQCAHDSSHWLSGAEKTAIHFIRMQYPDVSGEITLESLDYWNHKRQCFALVFKLAGDEDGFWRVQFENGAPKFSGRDD